MGESGEIREVLMRSLGYWEEGENLLNRCESYSWSEQLDERELNQVLQTLLAAYQWIGLDLTGRAIVEYGKALGWPSHKRQLLTQNLVQQYCSPNLSLISLRGLRERLQRWDRYGSGVLLSEASVQELRYSIALFRNFCSWGGEAKRPRLLSWIVQDPQFSALVLRKLGGVNVQYDGHLRVNYLGPAVDDAVSVSCQGTLCRLTSREDFLQYFSRILGGADLVVEMERVYCHHLRFLQPNVLPRNGVIEGWVKSTRPEERLLMAGQLAALVTGIPELFLQVSNYRDLVPLLRPSYRQSWDFWARETASWLARDLSFEESLSLQSKQYRGPDIRPQFGVTAGEWDRILLKGWKGLTVRYPLSIPKKVLLWAQGRPPGKREQVLQVLRRQITVQIKAMEQRYAFPPWSRDPSGLFAEELLRQLLRHSGVFPGAGGRVEVPIELQYGPFALKYIHLRRRRGGQGG